MNGRTTGNELKLFSNINEIIKKLEKQTRKFLYLGFVVAIIFNLSLVLFFSTKTKSVTNTNEVKVVIKYNHVNKLNYYQQNVNNKHITVKKQGFHRKEYIGKNKNTEIGISEISIKTKPVNNETVYTSLKPNDIAEPSYKVNLPETQTTFIPETLYTKIERMPEKEISLNEELLVNDDFVNKNDKRIKGLVVFNPKNKLALTGMIYLPTIYDMSHDKPINLSVGIIGLSYALNSYSDIIAKVDRPTNFYQNINLRNPFIYIGCGSRWEYRSWDVEGIKNYIIDGGFVVLENKCYESPDSPIEANLKHFIKDALGSQVNFEILPNNHPLYQIFFDFDGPPIQAKVYNNDGKDISYPIPYIEGIYYQGRMVGIYSNKGWGNSWYPGSEAAPQMKIGVNMVVYAMKRQGGLNVRKIDYTLNPGKHTQNSFTAGMKAFDSEFSNISKQ
jgi:hypothetical protein